LYGLAYRTDFDLSAHSTTSGIDLSYFDEETKERCIPHCVEPSFGLDRSVLAVLSSAYTEDELGGETRSYLKLSPKIAPVLVAVSPLLKNKPELVLKAREVFGELKKKFGRVTFDDNGNIGKRYRRQDEIGTPFCVVIDFETIEQGTGVTIRDRDTGEQKRMQVSELIGYIEEKLV
jgi:glycyl-tRNA synthetase